MSKGLEAFGRLTSTQNLTMYEQNECMIIIEKELKRLEEYDKTEYSALIERHKELLKEKKANAKKLKALEIIKEKIKIEFNDHYFGIKGNYYIIVNNDVFKAINVDKEQFDLLKEVLQ